MLLSRMVSLLYLWQSHGELLSIRPLCYILSDSCRVSYNCKSAILPEHALSVYIDILPFCSFLPTTNSRICPLHALDCTRQIDEHTHVASKQPESMSTCQAAEPFQAKLQELYLNICGVLAPFDRAQTTQLN